MKVALILVLTAVGMFAQSDRPWMQGSVEKFCNRSGAELEKMKKEFPNHVILACACKHSCDPMDPHAEENGGVKWDAACEARCNPHNCNCPHPCDS